MRASSKVSRLGAPSGALAKLQTLSAIGRTSPSSLLWPRNEVHQAPDRFEGRAK